MATMAAYDELNPLDAYSLAPSTDVVAPRDLGPCPPPANGRIVETVEVDRNGLEVLSREECLQLLRTASLGRIGVSVGALPMVLPVNFRLVGDRIVFRTGRGTKLDAAVENAVVAFEVDDMDPMSHTGWSVVATGLASEVTDPAEVTALEAAGLPHWAKGIDGRVVAVSMDLLSGRRLRQGVLPGWNHA